MPDASKRKKAVIDIGTNSIKLCVGEGSNISWSVTHDKIKITRLGEGLNKSELSALSSERSITAIQNFAAKAREAGADEIRAIGTAALRKAANANDFCARVKDTCGIDIEIISGEREAQLSHGAAVLSAAASGADTLSDHGRKCVVFDIGGGSIEFIFSENVKICRRCSLNFGVLDIKGKYFMNEPAKNAKNAGSAGKKSVSGACLEIAKLLDEGRLIIPKDGFTLIGIGGTVTTMASVKLKLEKYLPDKVNGTILNAGDVESQIDLYLNSTLAERVKIPGLDADRADIILAGACIVETIMSSFSAHSLIVSANGLRHAALAEMFQVN
ncbi:MAG: Ppx/GppA family phosphatase [Synergistaceae bacterium]|nr:Ppx/GppA family phosphatase [Synergistaceae bacterium]